MYIYIYIILFYWIMQCVNICDICDVYNYKNNVIWYICLYVYIYIDG